MYARRSVLVFVSSSNNLNVKFLCIERWKVARIITLHEQLCLYFYKVVQLKNKFR